MGEAGEPHGLSHAARGRAPDCLAARSHLKRFLANEQGATLIEYGVIIGVLSVALAASFGRLQAFLINLITNAITLIP